MASLSIALTFAVKECGWITANPMLRVYKLQEFRSRDRILSKEECERLLAACAKSRNALLVPIVTLAITTGMRQGEILNLTWNDIDLDQGIVTIKDTKNGRPHSVHIVATVVEQLKKLAEERKPNIPFVFPSKKRFGKIAIRKAWEEALAHCGIKDLRFHDLRHTFCTYAANSGASNLQLKSAMGHQTTQMLERYTTANAIHIKQLSEFVEMSLFERKEVQHAVN